MSSVRYTLPDLVKLVLAFLVVNLHVESFVTGAPFTPLYFLGWFAVPLFVSISFYFNSGRYESSQFTLPLFRHKLWRLILPFLVWSAVGFALHPDLLSIKYLLRQLLTGAAVDPPLYYLLTVVFISLLFYFLSRAARSHKNFLFLTLIVASLVFESSGLAKSFYTHLPIQISLAVERMEEFVKYAALGILLPMIAIRFRPYRSLISLATLFGTSFYLWWLTESSPTDLNYSGILQFILIALIMLAVVYTRAVRFGRIVDWLISHFAPYSLGVYCLHTFFVEHTPASISLPVASLGIFALSLFLSWALDQATGRRFQAVFT
jgi:hypothetical protein